VKLKLAAFQFQKYGMVDATIAQVSAHATEAPSPNRCSDALTGTSIGDALNGYAGADLLRGWESPLMATIFTEALSLTGTSIGDALNGYAGADLIQGLAGDDWLDAGAADDTLEGGEGDDELIGGAGADTLRGGLGNDTYTVDAADTVEELADEGRDTVLTDSSYALGANLENLTLTGESTIDGTGNAAANVLTGNAAGNALAGLEGADELTGGDGADSLDGGADDDLLAGGAGDDEYVLSLGSGADTIEDALGANTIRFGAGRGDAGRHGDSPRRAIGARVPAVASTEDGPRSRARKVTSQRDHRLDAQRSCPVRRTLARGKCWFYKRC
jgi:Ca2+-binding RTX toxin-like protein